MEKTTCILPVAGIGKRLQPHTFTLPKVLIHVAGKPILGYLIDFVKSLGIRRIVFIVGHLGEKVVEYVNTGFPEIESIFVKQEEYLGLGYAVNLARENVSGPVLINLGDTLIEADVKEFLKTGRNWVGVKDVGDPRRFGVAVTGPDGLIERLVEKPKDTVSRRALCGIYYFNDSSLLFESLTTVIGNKSLTSGEYQLTDAMQLMIEKGEKIFAFEVECWFDSGKIETLLQTNRYLLEKQVQADIGFPSVVINPPVYIEPGAHLKNCVAGPYVSIGKNVSMVNVIVQNSIINEGASLKNVVLRDSVIGYSASLVGNLQTINLGDSSQVNLMGEEEIQ